MPDNGVQEDMGREDRLEWIESHPIRDVHDLLTYGEGQERRAARHRQRPLSAHGPIATGETLEVGSASPKRRLPELGMGSESALPGNNAADQSRPAYDSRTPVDNYTSAGKSGHMWKPPRTDVSRLLDPIFAPIDDTRGIHAQLEAAEDLLGAETSIVFVNNFLKTTEPNTQSFEPPVPLVGRSIVEHTIPHRPPPSELFW